MIKKFISICALALSFWVFVAPAAQAGGHCGCGKVAHKMHKAIEHLDLTAEQKDKIKAIRDKTHEVLKGKYEEMMKLEMMVNESFKDSSINEAKIDEFANKKMHIVGDIMKTRMMERFEISKVLTAEQKQKVQEMLQKWMEHHAEKHHKTCHAM